MLKPLRCDTIYIKLVMKKNICTIACLLLLNISVSIASTCDNRKAIEFSLSELVLNSSISLETGKIITMVNKTWEGKNTTINKPNLLKDNTTEKLDTVLISANNKGSNRKINQYNIYKSVLVNQTGFSTEIEFGTGGGGSTMYTLSKANEPDYTIRYQHQFRSQHIALSLRYNFKNLFSAFTFTREHIQPQDGKRIENIPSMGEVVYPGLNNYFPKDKNYYMLSVGYDIRNNFRLFFTPFVGVSLYSYQGSKKMFNDLHKERIAYSLGLKSYFITQNNLLFFVQGYYSRQLFRHESVLVKDPRTYDLVTFEDNSKLHNQIFISFGFQFKLSKNFN